MVDWDMVDPNAVEWLQEHDFDFAYADVDITPEQLNLLRQELIGCVSGERASFQAMREITKILGLPPKASDPVKGISYRAECILRTEVNRAYNVATYSKQRDLAKQVPGLQKGWMATGDDRTRDSHLAAHGQVVLVNEPFIIGPDKVELMYPLDPAGPAHEVINCRCKPYTVLPEFGKIPSPLDTKIEEERARRARRHPK